MTMQNETPEAIIIGLTGNNFPVILDNYVKLGMSAVDMCKVTGSSVILKHYTKKGDLEITPRNVGGFDKDSFVTTYRDLLKAVFKAYLSPPTTIRTPVSTVDEFKRTIGAITAALDE